jgi:hypothetical protein
LDRAQLKVGLNRPTLVDNPMWAARLRESAASVTPIEMSITTYLLESEQVQRTWEVCDLRGQHLAMDRSKIKTKEGIL